MSDKNLEQRINIKFRVKIGKSASEMLALLTVAYGKCAMKKSSVFECKGGFGNEKISAKMVPRILTHDQKQRRLHISSDLLRNAETFASVIAGDETWCFQYDPETKRQSVQWKTQNSPRPKKARMSRSQVKTMLVCFFDHKGIVHY